MKMRKQTRLMQMSIHTRWELSVIIEPLALNSRYGCGSGFRSEDIVCKPPNVGNILYCVFWTVFIIRRQCILRIFEGAYNLVHSLHVYQIVRVLHCRRLKTSINIGSMCVGLCDIQPHEASEAGARHEGANHVNTRVYGKVSYLYRRSSWMRTSRISST